MKSFKLELRVFDSNTRRWQVFLERIREDHIVQNWIPPAEGKDYFSKTWSEYTIADESLEVYLACTGYGGTAQCIVLINDDNPAKRNTIFSRFDDARIASKSFPI
jgi:hypothetical protein